MEIENAKKENRVTVDPENNESICVDNEKAILKEICKMAHKIVVMSRVTKIILK